MKRDLKISFFEGILGKDLAEEQKTILSKKRSKGLDSLTSYECARLVVNRTLARPYSQEANGNYQAFEKHTQDAEERLKLLNLPQGLSSELYSLILGEDKKKEKVRILRKTAVNGKRLSNLELETLKTEFDTMKTYLSTHYEENKEGFTRYDSKGNKLHYISKKGTNGESWNKYSNLMTKTIHFNEQPIPDPERLTEEQQIPTFSTIMPLAA